MSRFARATLHVFRKDPLQVSIAFRGVDLTGVALSFAVKAAADAGGAAILLLTSGGGIAVVDVATDAAEVPTSMIQISKAKADFVTALAPYPAREPGEPVRLAFDLQWTPPGALVAPLAAVEATLLFGDFMVWGSVND